LQLEKE